MPATPWRLRVKYATFPPLAARAPGPTHTTVFSIFVYKHFLLREPVRNLSFIA
jgi:hypothetical protein